MVICEHCAAHVPFPAVDIIFLQSLLLFLLHHLLIKSCFLWAPTHIFVSSALGAITKSELSNKFL